MAEDPIVTLATYMSLAEADVARSKLAAMGIESWLLDDNVSRYYGAVSVQGVRLQVSSEDAETAWEVLAGPIPAQIQDSFTGEIYQQPRCPDCGSLDVSVRQFDEQGNHVALGPGEERWYCEDCQISWEQKPDEEPI